MGTMIKGQESQLRKIFSDSFVFKIPDYQRPYAWTIEETGKLFDDLYAAFKDNQPNYFLGSIVLVKEDDESKPEADVIDGQQRLTTLTILLALIASRYENIKRRIDYERFINSEESESQDIISQPRLRLRERDNEFFHRTIQQFHFDVIFEEAKVQHKTEAQDHIVQNTILLSQLLDENIATQDELRDFGKFLVQQCVMIVVSTPTRESSYRVFSVINSRGLSLLTTDILKAEFIGAIEEQNRSTYTKKWEDIENDLTRDGFQDMFSQIRSITRRNSKKSLLDDFHSIYHIGRDANSQAENAKNFIDNDLRKYSEAYDFIRNNGYCKPESPDEYSINESLYWLNQIDNSDWKPVALAAYTKYKNVPKLMSGFYKKLERLAAFMRSFSWRDYQRIPRYTGVLKDLDNNAVEGFGASIDLTDEEKNRFVEFLNSDLYNAVQIVKRYLILRLDSFVSDGDAVYRVKKLSIEHILPQTVEAGSPWEETWPDKNVREKWLHKIGNLIPLTKRTNSAVSNKPFDEKKQVYIDNPVGTISYNLATQVISFATWTPADVEWRQNLLITTFKDKWDLNTK